MKTILSFLIIFIFVFRFEVQSQEARKVIDTLNVVTFQRVKIPKDKNWVFTNIKSFNSKVKLYNNTGQFLSDINDIWRSKSEAEIKKETAGGRGTMIQASAFVVIEKPGSYFVDAELLFLDEYHKKISIKGSYLLNVVYPTIASNVSLREDSPYYYTEKLSFSFATLEFANPNNYSYEILNSSKKIIESRKTSLVVLDTLFNDLQNIGQTFTIRGLYNGKTFSYIGQDGKKVHLSEWKVTLAAPNTANLSDWAFDDKNTTLGISIYNPAARRIFYTMNASTSAGSYVFVKPIIKNLTTRSEPQGLLTNVRIVSSNVFELILFDYDPLFIESMEDYSAKEVKIIIEFDTQFNKHEKFEYKATLLK